MATITLTFTSNADGTMTIAGSAGNSSSGMLDVIKNPTMDYSRTWKRNLVNFILGTLYP